MRPACHLHLPRQRHHQRPLHLLSATLASLVGVQAVEFTGKPGDQDFRIGFNQEFTIGDLLAQGSGWSPGQTLPGWTGTLSNGAPAPGISINALSAALASYNITLSYFSTPSQGWVPLSAAIAPFTTVNLGYSSQLEFQRSLAYSGTPIAPGTALINFNLWDSLAAVSEGPSPLPFSPTAMDLFLNTAPTVPSPPIDINNRVAFTIQPTDPICNQATDGTGGIPLSSLFTDVLGRQLFSNPDPKPAQIQQYGIAVVYADSSFGQWYYQLPGDTSWSPIVSSALGPVGDAHEKALLLAGSDPGNGSGFQEARLSFVPNFDTANFASFSVELSFHVWDRSDETLNQSLGEAQTWTVRNVCPLPDFTDAATAATCAYSTHTIDVMLGTNHAPQQADPAIVPTVVVSAPLDLNNQVIFPVSALIAQGETSSFSDQDGDPLGVAITELLPSTDGTWEYDADGTGTSYQPFATADFTSTNESHTPLWLFLGPQAALRYTPADISSYANGFTIGNLSYKAWDQAPAPLITPPAFHAPVAVGGMNATSIGSVGPTCTDGYKVTVPSFTLQVTLAPAATSVTSPYTDFTTVMKAGRDTLTIPYTVDTSRLNGSASLDPSTLVVEYSPDGSSTPYQTQTSSPAWLTVYPADITLAPPGTTTGFWRLTIGGQDALATDTGNSTSAQVVVQMQANQAPIFTHGGTPPSLGQGYTPTTLDLAGGTPGPVLSVGDLVLGFSDPDQQALVTSVDGTLATSGLDTPASDNALGLVITALDTADGFWEVSVDGGASWTSLTSPLANGSGIYLDPTDQLRFNYTHCSDPAATVLAAALTFSAWDGSDRLVHSPTAQVLPSYSASGSVSQARQSVDLPVTVPSDPPAISISPATGPSSPLVLSELAAGASFGLTALSTRSGGSASLGAMSVSFSSDGTTYGDPVAVPWITQSGDRSTIVVSPLIPRGSAGWWRITVPASDSILGTASAAIILEVTPAVTNHAPAYSLGTPTPLMLPSADLATLDLTGSSFCAPIQVADLLGGFTDADGSLMTAGVAGSHIPASNNTLGLVLVGLDPTHGVWQASQDAGATWTAITAPAAGTGIYLDPSDRLRFSYTACNDISAAALANLLTFRAWDGSDGLPANLTPRALPASPGGASAVSQEMRSVNLPVMVNPATVSFTPVPTVLAVAGQPISVILAATTSRPGSTVAIDAGAPLPGGLTLAPTGLAGSDILGGSLATSGAFQASFVGTDRYLGSTPLAVGIQVLPANRLPLAAPAILTTGADGVAHFTAIGGGTPEGLADILAALAGKDDTQVRAFAWNALIQDYAEVTGAKPSWLTPEHALFIVASIDLHLDLSGVPQAMPGVLTLYPGWNLLTVPPLTNDGTTTITDHPWADFQVQDAAGNPLPALAQPWWWDGASYQQVATLHSGAGYWLHDPDASGTPPRRLLRLAAPPASAPALFATRRLQADAAADTPPPPPGATSSAAAPAGADAGASGGGSCGLGNGVAGLLLAAAAALRSLFARAASRR